MFRFRWFRSMIRKRTGPIPQDVAQEWRNRLTKLYVFLGFNIMGLITYATWRDKIEIGQRGGDDPVKDFSYLTEGRHARYYKIQGLTVVESYDLNNPESAKDANSNATELNG